MKLPTYGGIYNLPTYGGFCDSKPTSLGYHQSPFSPSFHRSVSAGSCTWRCAAAAATVRRLDVDSSDGEDGGDEACVVRSQGHCSATAVLRRCDGSCHVALGDASSFSEKKSLKKPGWIMSSPIFVWSEMGHKSLFLSIFCPKSPWRGAAAPTARLPRRLRRSRAALGHTPWPLGTLHLGPGDFATSGCSWRYSSLLSPSTPLETLV